jgi:TRAP-type C4-dicarboxylate transport system substrate-binding protein
MKKKALLLVALLLAGTAVLIGATRHNQAAHYVIRMVIAHDPPSPYYVEAVRDFANRVREGTHGDVEVQVKVTDEHVDKLEVAQDVAAGDLEMTAVATSVLGHFDNSFYAYELPYLFRNYDHVAAVIDGPIGQRIADSLIPHGMRGLAYTYSGGYEIIPTLSKEIHSPADVKGLAIRVPPNPVCKATIEAWGGKAVVSGLASINNLADRHMIEGAQLTYSRYFQHEMTGKVINETHHCFFLTAMVINEKFYQSLPAEYQHVVNDAAKAAAKVERAKALEEIAQVREDCRARGCKMVTLNYDEMKAFEVASAGVYTQFASMFPRGLVADIQAAGTAVATHTSVTSDVR